MLLVYGPRSVTYDFGPTHPLTPRRFGPGLDLLRAVGATPGLAPEPAPDAELEWCHDEAYIEVVKRFSTAPFGPPRAGIGEGGDDPPFAGMHDAAAMVAGGSIRAVEAILRGEVEHAFHPGGGLHHAMPGRASGFCIYDDVALAIARARRDGLRVLYIDLDVHHGDGVQAIHWDDPGVMTVSIHESGMTLFPGSGFADETGEGVAAGTSVNVPLAAATGERAWLETLRMLLPELAAAFGPDLVVSQHGADSHAWDPLAHLRMTTTAMGEAARLVDEIAHRYAGGRWLATGGGGYDAYRVVPRMWSLVWLAGAHEAAPTETPAEWRERWAGEGARYGQAPLPRTFDDAPNAGLEVDSAQQGAETASTATARAVRRALVPRLLREARDRGWWDPLAPADGTGGPDGNAGTAEVIDTVDRAAWDGLALAPRVVAPADARHGHALIAAALDDGAHVSAAVVPSATGGGTVVGAAVASAAGELLALGVAPDHRRQGLAGRLLAASEATLAEVTIAERDPIDPLDRVTRAAVARALLGVGLFHLGAADRGVRAVDPLSIRGDPLMPAGSASGLPAKDLVDVRLSDAFLTGGCPICAVRARSERAMLDTIIAERVLDIPFRESLERTQGFCRRHVAELVLADRRGPGGILGSSILYGAMLDRRVEPLRGALGRRGRSLRTRLAGARKRPQCLACDQGASAVDTALGRLVARSGDPAWAQAMSTAPFCLDDLVALWTVADGAEAFEPIARRQVDRLTALRSRLQGFVDHSAHDRRHLLVDDEGTAAGEAAELLGGTRPDSGPRS